MAKGVVGLDYFVITQDTYDDLVDIFGSVFMSDFISIDGIDGYYFAKQIDILGDEYGDIVDMIGATGLGYAYFTRSTEPNWTFDV